MTEETEHPLISVCIANFNGMNVIEDCLGSVKSQSGSLPIEIIVHDDASIDGSADYINTHHPDAILIRSPENVGYCVSNNRMVARAQGQYILLLNNDAALYSDAIATLYEAAIKHSSPAILSLPQYDWATGALIDAGSLLDPFLNSIPNLDLQLRNVGMVAGACLWIPHKLWLKLGGFPIWFGSIGEDLFLSCYARLAGYSVFVLPTSGYRHRVGQSFGGGKVGGNGLSTTFKRRAASERNKTFVMSLVYPNPVLQLIFPVHLALLLVEGISLAFIRRDRRYLTLIYIPVFQSLFAQRKNLIEKRREVIARRKLGIWDFFKAYKLFPHKLTMLLRHGLPHMK
jgi:GT2 family glycosyltransferase